MSIATEVTGRITSCKNVKSTMQCEEACCYLKHPCLMFQFMLLNVIVW
jgi:hypothetical protein